MELIDRIKAAQVHHDWTAQLHPPHERAKYDHVLLKVTPAERDQIVAALSLQPVT